MDMLRQEHAAITKLLDVIERQVKIFNQKGTSNFDIIDTVLNFFLRYPSLYHHPKEDFIFCKLCARDPGAEKIVGDLQKEHKDLEALTRELATLTHNICMTVSLGIRNTDLQESFIHAAQNYVAFSRRHMEVEEKRFFPAALESLAPEDWAEIDAHATGREDRLLIDKKFGRRVEILLDYIDRLEHIDSEADSWIKSMNTA